MHRLTSGVQDKVYAKIECRQCRSLQPEDVFVLFPDFPASEAIAEAFAQMFIERQWTRTYR